MRIPELEPSRMLEAAYITVASSLSVSVDGGVCHLVDGQNKAIAFEDQKTAEAALRAEIIWRVLRNEMWPFLVETPLCDWFDELVWREYQRAQDDLDPVCGADDDLRRIVPTILAHFRDPELLIQLLASGDPDDRRWALEALGDMETEPPRNS